ncbi:MAG: SPOR domain-containing protein, partial [Novosphingobium sp.]
KENPTPFKGLKPSITAWGQANRLLAGPFGSAKEANAFLAALKKAGVGGAFVWTSPAGQVVDALGGSK